MDQIFRAFGFKLIEMQDLCKTGNVVSPSVLMEVFLRAADLSHICRT